MGFKEGCVLIYIIITLAIISNVHLEAIQFDGEGCDKINLLVAENQECPSVGLFSVPGDCTVFYKCLKEDVRVMPILEYCGKGYNFNRSGCIPSTNKTDCPQFHCVAALGLSSDDSNTHNSKDEVNSNNQISSTEISDFTTTTENSWEIISSEEESSGMPPSDHNSNKLDQKSKNITTSSFEIPGEPFPYKSLALSYNYNLKLLSGFSLINIMYTHVVDM